MYVEILAIILYIDILQRDKLDKRLQRVDENCIPITCIWHEQKGVILV